MKKLIVAFLAVMMFVPAFAGKKQDKQTLVWNYEVQDLDVVAKDGKSVIFKIWSYDKSEKKAIAQARKNAVHAVIFKQIGYNPALAGTEQVEAEHADFFKEFFADGGAYMRFVTMANNGAIGAGDNIKLKGQYKVGIRVTVNRADLRKYLEQKGILQSMNSLF